MDDESEDVVGRALADLEDELAEVAEVHRQSDMPGVVTVNVTPRNSEALPITWTCMGSEIILQAGTHGARWELARTQQDIAFMQRVIRSIIAGRVRETFGPERSCVEVTLEDGTTVTETGYSSVLPRPGWRRRGRTVEFQGYRP